jgi:outer membrane autotransporter protein
MKNNHPKSSSTSARGINFFPSLLILLAVSHASFAQAPYGYSIQSLGANTTGVGISPNSAYVTGYHLGSGFTAQEPGFLWTQSGGAVELPMPLTVSGNYVVSSPNAVNNSGVAVGAVSETTFGAYARPVIYINGNAMELHRHLGSTAAIAYGINNSGTIVGTTDMEGSWRATKFTTTNSTFFLNETPDGAIPQYAFDVADTGRIVGQAGNEAGVTAFYLDPDASDAVNLGLLPGMSPTNSVAFGVSSSGNYITGYGFGGNGAAFIYSSANGTAVPIPNPVNSYTALGKSVNDSGWVVGSGGMETSVPFLYDGTNSYTLQSLLEGPTASGWNLVLGTSNTALGISSNGTITGRGVLDGVVTGFVMSPIPEPEPATAAQLLYLPVAGGNGIVTYDLSQQNPETIEGSRRTFASGLNAPSGIALDGSGNVYVVNQLDPSISKFSPEGALLLKIGSSANLDEPLGLAVDYSGNIYAANFGVLSGTENTIAKFNASGNFSSFITKDVWRPDPLAVDSLENLYAGNWFEKRTLLPGNTVNRFSSDGNFSASIGNSTTIINPSALAFDRFGNLFVSSGDMSSISKFDADGNFLMSIGDNATITGQTAGISVDADGNLYVSSGPYQEDTSVVSKFDSSGKFLFQWNIPSGANFLAIGVPNPAVWDGGAGLWSETSNWQGGLPPTSGDAIEFSGAGGVSTNNLAGGNLSTTAGLAFTSSANGSYSVNGSPLAVGYGGITNKSLHDQTVAFDIILGADQSFAARTANLTVSGDISGDASLTKTGNQTLFLSGSNTFTGNTTVQAGVLAVTGNVTGTGGIAVKSGTLAVQGGGLIETGIGGNLTIGVASGDNGALEIAGIGIASYAGYIGKSVGSTGMANVSGGIWTSQQRLYVGQGGNGTLNLTGGAVSNDEVLLGNDSGSVGVVNMGNGTWTSVSSMVVGGSGSGTFNLSGGSVSAKDGVIAKQSGSVGLVNLGNGSWFNESSLTVGDRGNGTLNITGGLLDVAGGNETILLAKEPGSIGTMNLGNGSSMSNLFVEGISGGGGTAAVNINFVGNLTFSTTLSGGILLTQKGPGGLVMIGNKTYSGGTSIQNGTVWAVAPKALGTGSVVVDGGQLLATSSQETYMGNQTLSIGGDLTWNKGTIGFYDTGSSPSAGNLTINVGGNFTVAEGNKTFDFSMVQALKDGNYTLVNATGISAAGATFLAAHGPLTTLYGNFTTVNNTVVYSLTGAVSGGSEIRNDGGPNTPVMAVFNVTQATKTIGLSNTVQALNFTDSGSLAIDTAGQLTVSSGNLNVQTGTSVVSGGMLETTGNLQKLGTGELDLQSDISVNGVASVDAGLLSVNGQLLANAVTVNSGATLGGSGTILAPVTISGTLSPGNSPGTLSMAALSLTPVAVTDIEIASLTNFDRIVVGGQATLGGTLSITPYDGNTLAYGQQYNFLTAGGGIAGEFDTITAPETFRGRFLNLGTTGVLLIAPETYARVALTPNQREVAQALDSFIPASSGDRETVSIALDLQTAEQYPYAFEQIMPGFYESLANIAIEQTYNQTQLLTQRMGSVRLGATGFQAIGMNQPIKYDKDGKSTADAKTASPIVESAIDTKWNSWVIANGEFSISRGLAGVPNYNNNAGGFLVGADYRMSENFAAGLFAGYEYSYAKYNGGSSTAGNSALFGLYGSYTHEDGYYADAIVSGGYTGFQTRRSIEFSTIDRTASADPNSGQFSAALNLGKDFEIGKFTFGPIIGAQYSYAGIGSFTESGAESLDLVLGQQNANSLRTNLGARLAYNWEVGSNTTLIPEIRGFWMHEFLNNPRNITSSLDGGNGASFDYETSAPYRNSVFGGAGISAKFADRWSASVFYNVNFGAEGYSNNIISTSLGFSF